MNSLDLEKLTLTAPPSPTTAPASNLRQRTHRNDKRFLKGPVPLPWLMQAARLPGKTLEVGVVLWFLSGLTKNHVVKLSNHILREFGVDRHAKYRALKHLVYARLVSVSQQQGCAPVVTILSTDEQSR